jgi:excisionase family DNA binding protein
MRFDEMLTTGEASALTGLHPTQLTKLCRTGKIESVRRGREWFIRRNALVAYMQQWHPEVKLEGKEE